MGKHYELLLPDGIQLTTREKRRRIQSFNQKQFDEFMLNFYKNACQDCIDKIEAERDAKEQELREKNATDAEVEEVTGSWDDILEVIASVPGLKQGTLDAIVSAVERKFM